MSQKYIKQQQSNGNSSISRRWKLDIKNTINDYNYTFQSAHAAGGKCDFCGNSLIYVAEIKGIQTKPTSSPIQNHSIGFDCLQLVFGRQWNDYRKAKREIDKLKFQAACKKRAAEYLVRYKDIIEWFNSLHSDNINNNNFLFNMKDVLFNGSRVFTIAMEGVLRRKMTTQKMIPADEYDKKISHHRNIVIPRIKTLISLICEVEGIRHPDDPMTASRCDKWSAFPFVNSVYTQAKTLNRLTENQIKALNGIHVKYTKMKKDRAVQKSVSVAGIPF